MLKKTQEQFRKFMLKQFNLHADPENMMDDAIMTLEWIIEKYEKESPEAHNEIDWLKNAKESLDTLKNEELYS